MIARGETVNRLEPPRRIQSPEEHVIGEEIRQLKLELSQVSGGNDRLNSRIERIEELVGEMFRKQDRQRVQEFAKRVDKSVRDSVSCVHQESAAYALVPATTS